MQFTIRNNGTMVRVVLTDGDRKAVVDFTPEEAVRFGQALSASGRQPKTALGHMLHRWSVKRHGGVID